MVKDLLAARFCTMASFHYQGIRPEKRELHAKLQDLHRILDQGLAQHGSEFYKGVKLLEGICLLRFAEMAAEHRP